MTISSGIPTGFKFPPLLVIAYLRPENLEKILFIAEDSGIATIFVSIDSPRSFTNESREISDMVHQVALRYKAKTNLDVTIFRRTQNVGCTPSVLSSCDWAFSQCDELIVLEDDCIPSADFFTYCRDSLSVLKNDSETWLACGTQFAPASLIRGSWVYSKYPLTWGWCTTRDKWNAMRNALLNSNGKLNRMNSPNLSVAERAYWNAGARRAFEGISDAWDTPLVQCMLLAGKRAILPRYPLISNVGNDFVATHTHGNASGIAVDIGQFSTSNKKPSEGQSTERWLQKYFFKISSRHILSTKITFCKDLVLRNQSNKRALRETWLEATIPTVD